MCVCCTGYGSDMLELTGVTLQPQAYLAGLIDGDSSNANARIKMQHGTTTLAFRYKGGCIVCVDSRATAGSYIGTLPFTLTTCIRFGS